MTEQLSGNGTKLLLRGGLAGVILLCVCLALLALLNTDTQFDINDFLAGPYFWQAVLLQCLALALFVLSWYVLLYFGNNARISYVEAAAHIGVTLVGKYLPGKVWGLLGRTYLLKQRSYRSGAAIELLIADQFLTFYTGIAIGGLALLAIYDRTLFSLACVLVLLLSICVVLLYARLIAWLKQSAKSVFRRLTELGNDEPNSLNRDSAAVSSAGLMAGMLVYFVHWLAISLVLWLLYFPALQANPSLNAMLLLAAIPLAMLSGFVAVWAPGGIGVREGVIIAILAINLPLELAASIAVTYRLICVINDLVSGSIAFAYYGSAGLQLLRIQQS